MKRYRTKFAALLSILLVACATESVAQIRTVRDATKAYGARLTAKGQPANQNQSRIASRVDSRLNTRLGLRIERYIPESVLAPASSYGKVPTDKSRLAPDQRSPQQ